MTTYRQSFLLIRAADILCIILSVGLASFCKYGEVYTGPVFRQMLYVFITVYVIATVITKHRLRRRLEELGRVIILNLAMACGCIGWFYLWHRAAAISRMVLALFLIIDIMLMTVSRSLMRIRAGRRPSRDQILIVTESEAAYDEDKDTVEQLYPSIKNFEPCFLTCMNEFEEKKASLVQVSFDAAYINLPTFKAQDIVTIAEYFQRMGVRCIRRLPDEFLVDKTYTMRTIHNHPVLVYDRYGYSGEVLSLKRMMDILGGLVGVFITGILTLILGPLIKLESPGPIFFSQTRIGRNGREFKIYKFRSMYQDAEQRKKELMKKNKMDGLMFKMDDDPRITKIGKFIRKTSLDEFPQFWNVLKGDMSLVGTRPPTKDEFEQYDEKYRRRLSMTPGLTGIWQISGRSSVTNFDDVVKMDLDYIDNWSIGRDIKIILKTVAVMFTGRGAE